MSNTLMITRLKVTDIDDESATPTFGVRVSTYEYGEWMNDTAWDEGIPEDDQDLLNCLVKIRDQGGTLHELEELLDPNTLSSVMIGNNYYSKEEFEAMIKKAEKK